MSKKTVILQGTFLLPVAVGQGAVISTGGKVIRTSRVVNIQKFTPSELHFETLNTLYRVSMEPSPQSPVSLFPAAAMAA